jgi:iron only hydrogenase large subunit-like protein
MTTLVETRVICTGSKTCGMTACEHYHEHEWTPACEGSCFDGGVCVEVKHEIMEARAQKIKIKEVQQQRALELTAGRAG